MKRTLEVPFIMKGTPCSRRRQASLKILWKTRYLASFGNPAKRVRACAKSCHSTISSSIADPNRPGCSSRDEKCWRGV